MNKYPGADKIKQKIERYCIYQDRNQQEVIQKLKDWGCPSDESENLLIYLLSEGFIDEERYCRSFVRGHFKIKNWGRRLILKHLLAKKVSDINIQIALNSEINEEEYEQTLERLALKKIRTDKLNIRNGKDRVKLQSFLNQKGYEFELIMNWIKNYNPESGDK